VRKKKELASSVDDEEEDDFDENSPVEKRLFKYDIKPLVCLLPKGYRRVPNPPKESVYRAFNGRRPLPATNIIVKYEG
jgi:hypothetical protein